MAHNLASIAFRMGVHKGRGVGYISDDNRGVGARGLLDGTDISSVDFQNSQHRCRDDHICRSTCRYVRQHRGKPLRLGGHTTALDIRLEQSASTITSGSSLTLRRS